MSKKNKNTCTKKVKLPERCLCSEDRLIITAHWWSCREWIYNHKGRDETEYIQYRNTRTANPKSWYGKCSDYINYDNSLNICN